MSTPTQQPRKVVPMPPQSPALDETELAYRIHAAALQAHRANGGRGEPPGWESAVAAARRQLSETAQPETNS